MNKRLLQEYLSPVSSQAAVIFEDSADLASANACYPNHSITTIRVWCRGEKNGWSFDKQEIDEK